MSNKSKYRIRAGRLGHEYAVLITFENKEDIEPMKKGLVNFFWNFQEHIDELDRANKELEKKKEDSSQKYSER